MKVSAVVTGILVAVGIATGYLVGRSTAPDSSETEEGSGSALKGTAGGGSGASDGERGGGGRRSAGGANAADRNPAATVRRIAREMESSPMAQMDFDVMFSTYEAVRWMNPSQIQEALAELEAMGGNSQNNMVIGMMLINLWAKQDGKGALDYSLASKNQMMKGMGVMTGMMGWVKNDPQGAWDWYEENKDGVAKSGMMGGQLGGMMFAALAQRDMDGAFAKMGDLNRQEKQSALTMIGMQTFMDDEKRANFVRNIEKLEDKELRDSSLQSMVTMWAFQDPQGAVEFIDSREWSEEARGMLYTQVTAGWSNSNPAEAINWRLEHLGEGEKKGDVVAGSFAQWMTRDPVEARDWLEAQPPELRTDQLYQQTAQQLQWNQKFDEAAGWAEGIENVDVRNNAYRSLRQGWVTANPEAAGEWFEGLDQATREAIEKGGAVLGVNGFDVPVAPTIEKVVE